MGPRPAGEQGANGVGGFGVVDLRPQFGDFAPIFRSIWHRLANRPGMPRCEFASACPSCVVHPPILRNGCAPVAHWRGPNPCERLAHSMSNRAAPDRLRVPSCRHRAIPRPISRLRPTGLHGDLVLIKAFVAEICQNDPEAFSLMNFGNPPAGAARQGEIRSWCGEKGSTTTVQTDDLKLMAGVWVLVPQPRVPPGGQGGHRDLERRAACPVCSRRLYGAVSPAIYACSNHRAGS